MAAKPLLRALRTCQDYLKYCMVHKLPLHGNNFDGTLYEFWAKQALASHLGLSGVRRVGGSGDNGLDLHGSWDLSRFLPKGMKAPKAKDATASKGKTEDSKDTANLQASHLSPKTSPLSPLSLLFHVHSSGQRVNLSKDITVLVQCKNYRQKIKVSTVRELAGIREFHTNMRLELAVKTTFMLLVSPQPLTALATSQLNISDVPMLHVLLDPLSLNPASQPSDYDVKFWKSGGVKSVYLNHKARSLLAGLEVEKALCGKRLATVGIK